MTTPPDKLLFWTTVRDSIVLTAMNAGVFFSYAWPYLFVLAMFDGLIAWAYYPAFERMLKEPLTDEALAVADIAFYVIGPIIPLLVGAALAVPWHQFIVEGRQPRVSDPWNQSGRVLRYAGWGVGTIVAFILAAIPIMLAVIPFATPDPTSQSTIAVRFGMWAMLVAFAFCLTPFYRFALIFPAAALGVRARLRSISYATRGNAFRLSFGSLLAALPSLLLLEFVPEPTQIDSRAQYIVSHVASDMINMCVGMSIVTFLSLAYRHFAPAIADAMARDAEIASGQSG